MAVFLRVLAVIAFISFLTANPSLLVYDIVSFTASTARVLAIFSFPTGLIADKPTLTKFTSPTHASYPLLPEL
jgi:hypothetical protein